jgi:hypothetical protein
MAWDSETDAAITLGRLMLLPPGAVYKELREYADHQLQTNHVGSEDLERGLLGRHDPLIDLGLASYSCTSEIVKELYTRGKTPADNEQDRTHRKALRVACLANRVVGGSSSRDPEHWIGEQHLSTLLHSDRDEIAALLGNPHIGGYFLEKLYAKEGPFADISDEQWRECVVESTVNPRLNMREYVHVAPDLGHYSCQKSYDRNWCMRMTLS